MRLPSLSSQKIIRVLREAGFTEAPDRGKGSHRAFMKKEPNSKTLLVIVPHGKDIPRGTLLAILEQASLSREKFLDLFYKSPSVGAETQGNRASARFSER